MATTAPGAYADKFGGIPVLPNQVGYNPVELVADTTLVWPEYPSDSPSTTYVLAGITAITSLYNGSVDVTLPDTTLVEVGRGVIIGLAGLLYTGNTVGLTNSSGGTLATLAEGDYILAYTYDNTVSAAWRFIQLGTGATFASASSYAGLGLRAIGGTLNLAPTTSTFSTNTTLTAANRASVLVNVGGAVTLTLPLTSAVSNDFLFEVRNQGTGTVTVTPVGGELVDSSATIALQVNESCFVHAATGAWYTVGRGRNASFNFTQLTKVVTGGTTALTTTEASNVVQKYTGALLSNQTLVVPSVVQVYYISNQTTGAFTFTIQSPTPGSTLVLPTGQNAVVFCDGVNVINCSTSLTGISALLLLLGSAGAPTLAFGAVNNGLFGPSNTTVAVSANGTEVVRWANGQSQHAVGSAGLPAYSFQLDNTTGMYRVAANMLGWSCGGTVQASLNVNGFGVGTFPSYKIHGSGTSVGGGVYVGITNTDTSANSFGGFVATHGFVLMEMHAVANSAIGRLGTFSNHTWGGFSNQIERFRVASTGEFLVGTGAITANGAKLQTADGITFPATAVDSVDPNTLDDYREASFTATATGMTTAPTGTVSYIRVGRTITMSVPAITGTSNSTAFTLTGGPAGMTPSLAARSVPCRVSDNSGAVTWGLARIETTGVITLFRDAAGSAFTAAGTKSVAACDFSYLL